MSGSRGPIPPDAVSVVVNLTAVNPSSKGFATLYPCTGSIPNASTINFESGSNIANSVVVKLSEAGKICLYTSQEADYVIDVAGFARSGSHVRTLVPGRVLDTRPNGVTIDGKFQRGGLRPAGTRLEIEIADPGAIDAAILNLTVVNPQTKGYATLFPCTQDVPNASSINYTTGTNIANAVTVQVSDAGTVCLFTSASAHFVLDAAGFSDPQSRDEDDDDKKQVRGTIIGGTD